MYCASIFDCEPPLPVIRIEHVDRGVEVPRNPPSREAPAMTMILDPGLYIYSNDEGGLILIPVYPESSYATGMEKK